MKTRGWKIPDSVVDFLRMIFLPPAIDRSPARYVEPQGIVLDSAVISDWIRAR